MLAKTNMKMERKNLLESLVLIVNSLRKPDVLGPALAGLGESHKELGAREEPYALFDDGLMGTFDQYFEDDRTPGLKGARADAYYAALAGVTA